MAMGVVTREDYEKMKDDPTFSSIEEEDFVKFEWH